MPIRVISWNIKFFAENVFTKHRNTILGEIWDGGAGTSKCDIFIVIEPLVGTTPGVAGEYIASGAGCRGVMELYYTLYALANTWRVVPPRASCAGSKADFAAIYYDSAVVTLVGPETGQVIPAPAASASSGIGGAPLPWGPGGTLAGQIEYVDDGGTPLDFEGRAPYAVQFRETGQAPATVQQAITLTVAAAPVAGGAGPLAVTTTQLPAAAPNEAYEAQLTARNAAGPVTWTLPVGALPTGLALDGTTGEISGVPTAAAATAAIQVCATDANGAAPNQALTINVGTGLRFTGAVLPDAVRNTPYDVKIGAVGGYPRRAFALAGGAALPAGLTLETNGRLHGTPTNAATTTFNVDVTDAGPSFFIVALHAPPHGGRNYTANANVTAMQVVADIREITTLRGRCSAVIIGDYNCCSLACCSGNDGPAFTTLDNHFTHRDFNAKTGMKWYVRNAGAQVAYTADYRTHYYDHIYTVGFTNVQNFDVLDLMVLDATWATWTLTNDAKVFNALFKKIARPPGVSDHLPVKVDLTP